MLALLDKHLFPGAGSDVVSSVEVRDLADPYRLRHSWPRDPAARQEATGSRA